MVDRVDQAIRLICRGLIAAADVGILPWCWNRTTLIPFWHLELCNWGRTGRTGRWRVVENVRGAAAGVDIAVVPRGTRACTPFRLLGVQDKLSGTLLGPGCRAAFVSGVPDGWVRRMAGTRVLVDGSEADSVTERLA